MASRDLETREAGKRKTSWKPPSLLPTPDMTDGSKYRWIRVASRGNTDNKNVSARFREGWVPVNAKEHPELQFVGDRNSEFTDGVEIGGLLLCKNDPATVKQRTAYYNERAQSQMLSVENNYMKESDPRMPLFKERKTRATFGNGGEE